MHLLLAITALLSAAPEVAVVKRSTTGVSDATVATVLRTVTEGLRAEGLTVQTSSTACSGDRPCLASIAKSSTVAAAIGVAVIRGRRDLTIDLEAVDGNQKQLAVQTFSVPMTGEPFPPEGAVFFDAVRRALKIDDAPREVHLTPTEAPVAPIIVRGVSGRTTAIRASTGIAIGSGVATIALLIAEVLVKGQLDQSVNARPPTGTRTEALAKASLANGLLSASLVAGGLTAAAGTTGLVLWARDESAEVE